MTIIIGKIKEENGCFGNMALFQAMRFNDPEIKEAIRAEKSPMGAKFCAKKYTEKMFVQPMSEQDLNNMRQCLRLKIDQHPELKKQLIETGKDFIVEDCTKRKRGSGLFWGAALENGEWIGQNWLGKLWMELRMQIESL